MSDKYLQEEWLDALAESLFRYATIVDDQRWVETEGVYKGNNRLVTFEHVDKLYKVEMINGSVSCACCAQKRFTV